MTDPVKEQLSACLDGELPEGELDWLLKQVNRDAELRASLGRYALIGETLRAKAPVVAPADFSARIAAAIAGEAVVMTADPVAATPRRWLRPMAGFAVAAGVAAVAVLSLRVPEPVAPAAYVAQSAPPAAAGTTGDAASYIVPANADPSAFVPAARLTNYVVAHSEYSSPLGRRSVLSGVLAGEESGDDPDDFDAYEPAEPAEVVTQP